MTTRDRRPRLTTNPDFGVADKSVRRAVRVIRESLSRRVVLVQAPGGWGKTTAVREALRAVPHVWIDAKAGARESGELAFALALGFGIATTALGQILQHVRSDGSVQRIVDWFSAHQIDSEKTHVVVDDLHRLTDDAISFDFVAALVVQRLNLHWVFLSRSDLPLPIADWTASKIAAPPIGKSELVFQKRDFADILTRNNHARDDQSIQRLRNASGGWPAAVDFLVRTNDASLRFPSSLSASMPLNLGMYLAEHESSDLSRSRRNDLELVAIAGSADQELVQALGISNPRQFVAWLQGSPLPLTETGAAFRLHDIVAEFLLATLDDRQRSAAASTAVEALLACHRPAEALRLSFDADSDATVRVLSASGLDLVDQGYLATVERGLERVPRGSAGGPAILGVRAAVAAGRRDWERCEALYRRAIARSSPDSNLRATLSRHLCIHLTNRGRPIALARQVLEPILEIGSDAARCESAALHALLLAHDGKAAEAASEISRSLEFCETLGDQRIEMRVRSRAATVAYHAGDVLRAESEVRQATRLSETLGDWGAYVICQSLLTALNFYHRGDSAAAIFHANEMAVGARRSGNSILLFEALRIVFTIEVELGPSQRLELLLADLRGDLHAARADVLFGFAYAVYLGWNGSFDQAIRELELLTPGIADPRRLDALWAMLGMFCALAGRSDDAKMYLRRRAEVPTKGSATFSRGLGDVVYLCRSTGEVFLGARRVGAPPKPSFLRPSHRTWFAAIQALARGPLGLDACKRELEAMRAASLGGIAELLFKALSTRIKIESSLSAAELRVLYALHLGSSPKQIAFDNKRSVETVRSQIKSAIRKLGASGSFEAVARARELGIFEP